MSRSHPPHRVLTGLAVAAAISGLALAIAWPAGVLDNAYRAADHPATPWLVILAALAFLVIAKRVRASHGRR